MPESEKELPDPNSKSNRKREMDKLREIAMALLALPQSQLDKISLPDELLELIRFAHSLKAHGAKKRHLQYITKQMRDMDLVQVQDALAKLAFVKTKQTVQFHAAEEWRDKLIAEGDAGLQNFIKAHPLDDIQKLRQLMRNAQQDKKKAINTGADKQLFKYLMTAIKPD